MKRLLIKFQYAGGREGIGDPEKKPGFTPRAALELAAPHTWPAAVCPVLLGTALAAARDRTINGWRAFFVLLTAVLLQSAVNTLNDRRDFVSGLDSAENCADSWDAAMVYAGATPRAALAWALALLLCAAVCGGVLVRQCGAAMLLYGGIGAAAIGLYVLPRVSASELPLGELLSGLAMGGALTCAAFHAQAERFDLELLYQCAPCVVTVGCIMLANNASDIEKDRAGGRRTLPVCMGRERAQLLLRTALILAGAGAAAVTLLCFPAGAAALPVMAASLALDGRIRRLYRFPIDPASRKNSMAAVLGAHSRIICCYTAAALLSALTFS